MKDLSIGDKLISKSLGEEFRVAQITPVYNKKKVVNHLIQAVPINKPSKSSIKINYEQLKKTFYVERKNQ